MIQVIREAVSSAPEGTGSKVTGIAQNISVTFTGTGAATQIDSVTATNLTTNQSVTDRIYS